MRRDNQGNLIFERDVYGDLERVGLISESDPVAWRMFEEGEEEAISRRKIARAMIDAGLEPEVEGLATGLPPLLAGRTKRFLDLVNATSVFVLREDEIEDVCRNLRQPIDRSIHHPDRPYDGERSKTAKILADNISELSASTK